jgi:hypothetical protein
MNTRRFVSGSSLILAGWLAFTFLYDVPAKSYPKLDKQPVTTAVKKKIEQKTAALTR